MYKRQRKLWAMERTKGGLKADPGGAPVSTASFPELAGESTAIPWAEIHPTKVLGWRRSRRCPGMARGGGRRRRCRPWKNGGTWGRRERRSSPPKSMPGGEGSRFALRWSGADGNGGSIVPVRHEIGPLLRRTGMCLFFFVPRDQFDMRACRE